MEIEEFAAPPAEYGRSVNQRFEMIERIPKSIAVIYSANSIYLLIYEIFKRLEKVPPCTKYTIECYGQIIFDKTKEELE